MLATDFCNTIGTSWTICLLRRSSAIVSSLSTGPTSASVRNRRFFPVAVHPCEGLLTEPTADARACRDELVLMPHTCRSQNLSGSAKPTPMRDAKVKDTVEKLRSASFLTAID